MELIQCSRCKRRLTRDDFYKDSRRPSGIYSACKSCHRQATASVYERDVAAGIRRDHKEHCVCGGLKSKEAAYCRGCPMRPIKPHKGYIRRKKNGSDKAIHRQVMEAYLGRSLLPGENVHHKNGLRYDNRLENLELWVSHQPSGQRVEDLLSWAHEIIARYEPVG